MSDDQAERWHLAARGHRHRVEIVGSFSRTVTWFIDDRLVAGKRSMGDSVQLKPGDLPRRSGLRVQARPELGVLSLTFTALGRPRRVTWYGADGDLSAAACALLGRGGIDLDPERGSPAARRENRMRRQPRWHLAAAVAGGLGRVVGPLLLGLLAVGLALAVPLPDWHLPSVPWLDLDLPTLPLPRVDLPNWQAPGWISRLGDVVPYVGPVVLAYVVARAEIRRRRQQDLLKAELRAAAGDRAGTVAPEPSSHPRPPAHERDEDPPAA